MVDRFRVLRIPSDEDGEGAWTSVYKALRPVVYSELFRVFPYPFEGLEDAWHDIFLKFFRNPSALRSVAPEARETYIRVTARRYALNYLRSRSRRETAIARIPTSQSSETASSADAWLDFEQLMSRIDERDRQLVEWRIRDEVSIAAIARRTGLSYSAAAVRIFRALLKAREELAKAEM